jgi:hypothetical protein
MDFADMLTLAAAVPGGPWTGFFLDVNTLARHTPWPHLAMTGYAGYGVVLFAGLLLAGLVERPPAEHHSGHGRRAVGTDRDAARGRTFSPGAR